MNIHAVICTRSREEVPSITDKLVKYLASCNIKVYLLANQSSIFEAYKKGYTAASPDPEDIMIFCHDDIDIRTKPEDFVKKVTETCNLENTAFVGPAGTTCLTENAVWWDQNQWRMGRHRGFVKHLDKMNREYDTNYGPEGPVVALDGLFLACKAKIVEEVGLDKPEYFVGDWDFYDIHYTTTAHKAGLVNRAIHLDILHASRGELVGRTSWHLNREAFIKQNSFPISL